MPMYCYCFDAVPGSLAVATAAGCYLFRGSQGLRAVLHTSFAACIDP